MQGAAEFVLPQNYNLGFRNRMIQRMTGPDAISASALSREAGVAQPTLSRWLLRAPTLAAVSTTNQPGRDDRSPKSPQQWTAAEKLAAVQEAAGLKDADLGAFLRRKGLRESDLAAWRALAQEGAVEALGGANKKSKTKSVSDARRIKELQQQLARTERRLSGVNALLDLQKKVREIWGDADAPTPGSSAS
jgi:transposase-like protein